MNSAQEKTLQQIKERLLRFTKTMELKSQKIDELGNGVVSVSLVIGFTDDENSVSRLLREYHHFFIGKRGGITKYNKKGKRVTGFKNLYK